ncbi:hypothetical protein EBU24_04595, partial [bacterium]|nr:hypothetical protein [bacterium]
TKFIPSLHEKNRKEKEYNATLLNEYHSLNNEKNAVERDRMVQDQLGKSILLKVKIWHEQVQKEQAVCKKEQQIAQEAVKKYLEHQAQKAVLDYAKSLLAPTIVNNTRQELLTLMRNDPTIHQKFIEKSLHSLNSVGRSYE